MRAILPVGLHGNFLNQRVHGSYLHACLACILGGRKGEFVLRTWSSKDKRFRGFPFDRLWGNIYPVGTCSHDNRGSFKSKPSLSRSSRPHENDPKGHPNVNNDQSNSKKNPERTKATEEYQNDGCNESPRQKS